MDINQLLKGVDCTCDKHHTCSIKSVYVEKDAISRLTDIAKPYSSILLVADENTFAVAGEKVERALVGKKVEKVIFSGKTLLIPNEQAIEKIEQNITDTELIIAIGSGVIQDTCKYVSHLNKIEYIDVATAPSMDGYASDGAAMILNGMKETVKAGLPISIICDTEILANAPMDMIKAGYGDVIGKYSALNDWQLSHLINGEYFCKFIFDLTKEQIEKVVSLAKGLTERNIESVASLMEALVLIGILMSFAGSSRPASGSEHHLSHYFEITGIVHDRAYLTHGLDVAYSTVVTSKIREILIKTDFSLANKTKAKINENEIERVYKTVANDCIKLQQKAGFYARDRYPFYQENQAQIKQILASTPTAEKIIKLLELVGLDYNYFLEFYSTEVINDAVLYAKDLKDRFTVLWLYYDLVGEKFYV